MMINMDKLKEMSSRSLFRLRDAMCDTRSMYTDEYQHFAKQMVVLINGVLDERAKTPPTFTCPCGENMFEYQGAMMCPECNANDINND